MTDEEREEYTQIATEYAETVGIIETALRQMGQGDEANHNARAIIARLAHANYLLQKVES